MWVIGLVQGVAVEHCCCCYYGYLHLYSYLQCFVDDGDDAMVVVMDVDTHHDVGVQMVVILVHSVKLMTIRNPSSYA